MLNYQAQFAEREFLKAELEAIKELSVLGLGFFLKIRTLTPNEDNSNEALMLKTGLSEHYLKKVKAELIDKGYLDIKQLFDNRYAFYIGKEKVKEYKVQFKNSENRRVQSQLKTDPLDKR